MNAGRWLTVATITIAFIIIPFLLFGESLELYSSRLLAGDQKTWLIATATVALLASDVFLPIPSSLVSTSAGALLGFPLGLLASTLGMTLGCILGYGFGWRLGTPLLRRFARESEIGAMERSFAVYGVWAVALFRPVPVLAEASVLFAGVMRIRLAVFAITSTLMNVVISALYCATGTLAVGTGSFIPAFAVLSIVAGLAFLFGRGLIASVQIRRRTEAAPVPAASPVAGGSGGGYPQTGERDSGE